MKRDNHEDIERLLAEHRAQPPVDFTERVLAALPEQPRRRRWPGLLAHPTPWWRSLVPALAGAAACLLIVTAITVWHGKRASSALPVVFDLRAPNAKNVELIGDFTRWQRGRIQLTGPDVAGHWSVTVLLRPGMHEYVFLVDNAEWLPDPAAAAYRADGFGHQNAVIDVEPSGETI
jgi:hypothetical protein